MVVNVLVVVIFVLVVFVVLVVSLKNPRLSNNLHTLPRPEKGRP